MITKIIKTIFSLIKTLITLVVIGFVAIVLIQRFSNNNLSVAGYRMFTVVTESMVPEYLVGDVLLVKETEPDKIAIGDDVTYMGKIGSYANKIVTHRVVNIDKTEKENIKFITRGIANDVDDPQIEENQIYGTVVTKLKVVTYLNGIINNMYGMYFLIIIPLAIIMFSEFRAFKQDDKRDYEEDDDENDDIDEDENKEDKKIDKKAQKRKEKRAKRRRKYE